MAVNIEHPEADFPVHASAAKTGESAAGAGIAEQHSTPSLREDLRRVQNCYRELPLLDIRNADEILEYDEHGLPL